jgi:DNA invertase Pin-like site-specific DNA recombinase
MHIVARVALYLRVSTKEQTTENQRRELEAWAERAGHRIVAIYEDAGISGSKGREARKGLDRALKDATRRQYDMLAVWSVDRLGRSLQDLVAAMNDLRAARVDLFLHQQALDTSTSAGKAMFGMLSVFGEFEREIIVERINAGIARAKAAGTKFGRPKVGDAIEERIRELRRQRIGIKAIARRLGIGTGTVQRVVAGDGHLPSI